IKDMPVGLFPTNDMRPNPDSVDWSPSTDGSWFRRSFLILFCCLRASAGTIFKNGCVHVVIRLCSKVPYSSVEMGFTSRQFMLGHCRFAVLNCGFKIHSHIIKRHFLLSTFQLERACVQRFFLKTMK